MDGWCRAGLVDGVGGLGVWIGGFSGGVVVLVARVVLWCTDCWFWWCYGVDG